MKDNFVDQEEEEGIGQYFEKQREEFRAQKRNQKRALITAVLSFIGGIYWLCAIDIRLGTAAILISYSGYLFYRFL